MAFILRHTLLIEEIQRKPRGKATFHFPFVLSNLCLAQTGVPYLAKTMPLSQDCLLESCLPTYCSSGTESWTNLYTQAAFSPF